MTDSTLTIQECTLVINEIFSAFNPLLIIVFVASFGLGYLCRYWFSPYHCDDCLWQDSEPVEPKP